MSDLARHVTAAKKFYGSLRERGFSFPMMIIAFRDSYPILIALPGELDPLAVGQLMASELKADEIVVITDTFYSEAEVNPVTGSPWRPGEMSVVAKHHDGVAKGWVTDALTLAKYDRFGTAEVAVVPYTFDPLIWGEEYRTDPGQPDASQLGEMTKVFNTPDEMLPVLDGILASQEVRDDILASALQSMGAQILTYTALGYRNN